MKKTVKKLVLAKETVRLLESDSVKGGAGASDATICPDGSGCGFLCHQQPYTEGSCIC